MIPTKRTDDAHERTEPPPKRCTQCGTIYPRDDQHFPPTEGKRGWCYQCQTMKRCKWCGDAKPLERFWKTKNGRDSVCADCRNEARREKDSIHNPVLTKDWPKKPNGLYKMYWEIDD